MLRRAARGLRVRPQAVQACPGARGRRPAGAPVGSAASARSHRPSAPSPTRRPSATARAAAPASGSGGGSNSLSPSAARMRQASRRSSRPRRRRSSQPSRRRRTASACGRAARSAPRLRAWLPRRPTASPPARRCAGRRGRTSACAAPRAREGQSAEAGRARARRGPGGRAAHPGAAQPRLLEEDRNEVHAAGAREDVQRDARQREHGVVRRARRLRVLLCARQSPRVHRAARTRALCGRRRRGVRPAQPGGRAGSGRLARWRAAAASRRDPASRARAPADAPASLPRAAPRPATATSPARAGRTVGACRAGACGVGGVRRLMGPLQAGLRARAPGALPGDQSVRLVP